MDDLRESLQESLGPACTLERELGGGGMSRVFLARDRALDREVVVKVLLPELAEGVSVKRFAREVHETANLQHPHIVPVLRAGSTSDGVPWYVMPFVRGETMRARMDRGRIGFGESLALLGDVAKALGAVHAAGLVHRDVKPDNIIVCGGAAVVTDFGIAHAMHGARSERDVQLTALSTSLGTPAYLAPEQAVGDEIDARTDIYSIGVVAYEMIAGHHAFPDAHTAQKLIAAHIAERPQPLHARAVGAPAWFCALVMSCIEKDPGKRPADGGDLLRRFDEAAEPPSITQRVTMSVRGLFGGRPR